MANPDLDSPYAVIFAGPNGSGKTTLIDQVRRTGLRALGGIFPVPEYFINPDQVARELAGNFATQDERDRAAHARGIAMRQEAIERRKSFAYETVMSHPTLVNEILQLKDQGYRVLLTFIATNDPEINVRRVRERYTTKLTTGHWVPEDRVRDRYYRIMHLLPAAAELADAVFVYDNSVDFAEPAQVVVANGDDVSASIYRPEWVDRHILAPLAQRAQEYEALSEAFAGDFTDAALLGSVYDGGVVRVTFNFVVQRLQSGAQVLHDRAILDCARESHPGGQNEYALGETLRITYSPNLAPVVLRTPAA